MRTAAIPLFVALELASGSALAQSTSDPLAQLRGCSLMERAERLKCLDRLSRSMAPPAGPASPLGNWTISETTSPVDYRPFVVAITSSLDAAEGAAMRLSIYCRNGRTELVVTGTAIAGRGEDYEMSYRVNGDQPVQTVAGSPSFGTGVAFKGDVVRLLQSLPEEGEVAVRLSPRTGIAREGNFSIGGLKVVRDKLAAACKWPQAIATPRN
ncbi:hypothetical protein HCN50_01570 [Bradyrhizobium sp. WSM 1744]|uniref:Type VI secretion system VasI, EvfG, VC_A0118 n=1 Tax=Bradyrhizobium archetypum TaxID=2721160 RepID=A0A7Y4LZR8_9BRAD|nr:hypothetical protein [Bradyrhizobium archetypum]